jgi:hypothetical protein
VGVAAVVAGGGQHLGRQVEAEHLAARGDRRPQVGEGAAGAAARVQGGLPWAQAHLGHGGRVGRVVVGEVLFPGCRPRGEEGAGLGQEHFGAEAVGHGRGGNGVGERLHNLGASGRLLGFDRRVHPDRPFGSIGGGS